MTFQQYTFNRRRKEQPIAICHYCIKIVSRGKGKSAVAAAYRAGETITNESDGVTYDYTRKGGIVHTEIVLPENAAVQMQIHSVHRLERANQSGGPAVAMPAAHEQLLEMSRSSKETTGG